MDHVRWWKSGSEIINSSADQADARAFQVGDASGPPMKARLARSGHLSTIIGRLMVVSGGILRDGSLCVDLVIMDLSTLTFLEPQIYGEVPMTRFRHTGVAVPPEQSPAIQHAVNLLLHPAQRDASQGSIILMFGGYNTMGQEFGGNQFEAVWVAHDGSAVAWVPVKTAGHAPTARFHHTTTLSDGGKQVILYGGEGHELIDGAGGQPPNVYTLDVASLTWHRRSTTCDTPDGSPGVRSLHIATVRENPQTGHEELVVLAGYCSNVLASMEPHRLDLVTWQWFREPGLVPKPGLRDALVLPTPRQRTAGEVVGKKWVLMHAGSPTQFLQGNFLDDVNRLHLPSLTWRLPPVVHGKPTRALRNIAGHSLEGLIAFGGCIPTIMGIMPVAKTDPLLIGPPPALDLLLEKDLVHPACSLAPQPQAPPALTATHGAASLRPNPAALPQPSGAPNSVVTPPGPPELQPWRPGLAQEFLGSDSLGGLYWNHEENVQAGVIPPLARASLALQAPADPTTSERPGTSAAPPRAEAGSRQVNADAATAPTYRHTQGQGSMASTNQAQWSNVPNVAQLTSGLQAEEPTVPTASEGVLLQPDAVRQQDAHAPVINQARSSQVQMGRQGPAWTAAAETPYARPQHPGFQFVPMRQRPQMPDQQQPPPFWRHEVTGEFFTSEENEHHQAVMVPVKVACSESSDSVGSPNAVPVFQPEEDLNHIPPDGQAEDQGPCLMQ
ncbi:hypothetical protein ABBQ32_009785 [Trebouxia sp. C0010 RCD-2024]